MAVLPQIIRFFPCADADADDETGRITLIDPFSIVLLPNDTEYPCEISDIFFYVHVAAGLGTFYCCLEARAENGLAVLRTKPKAVVFDGDNRFHGIEFLLHLPSWDIPGPGLYQFSLFANHVPEPIGTTEIRFVRKD